ncbi:hypothetical protein AB6A40_009550 [Gnathostoma spinigerum]|uniref:Uncharacterized protein n=1 Tax=Gnathostoma spinigerum TaxID=75299 RepID=A0ABD6EZB4_9BILA
MVWLYASDMLDGPMNGYPSDVNRFSVIRWMCLPSAFYALIVCEPQSSIQRLVYFTLIYFSSFLICPNQLFSATSDTSLTFSEHLVLHSKLHDVSEHDKLGDDISS